MRLRLAIVVPAVLVALTLASCGDDGKAGSTGAPAGARGAPPPPPTTAGVASSWAGTREGDWATWSVSAEGTGAVTRLTWRATKVAGGRVTFTVESTTSDAGGTVLATTRTEEVHDLAEEASATSPAAVRGEARGEDVRVGTVAVPTTVRVLAAPGGDVETWTSPSVPFTGLVRAKGGGVEQALQGFGRGR